MLDLVVDDFLGLLGGGLARTQIFLDDILQIVHRVQIHILQFSHRRLDVARHRQIDHEHRPAAALFQTGAHLRRRQQQTGAGGGLSLIHI